MGYTLSLSSTATQNEGVGTGGATAATFAFTLNRDAGDASSETLYSYQIWKLDGTNQPEAIATSDFNAATYSANGSFNAGVSGDTTFNWTLNQTSLTLTLNATPDTTVEPNENFFVWFFRETGGVHQLINAGLSFSSTSIITLTNDDAGAPVFSSSATFNAPENGTAVGTVAATGSGTVAYTITGGTADDAKFAIDASGNLTFLVAKDAEAPDDIGGNRVYNIQVTATAGGQATNQAVTVNLTNVNEAPSFAAPAVVIGGAIPENDINLIWTSTATSAPAGQAEFGGDNLTYSLSGADASFFVIDSTTGDVRFGGTGANFEAVRSTTYNYSVIATDSGGLTATQTVQLTVSNVVEGAVISSNGGGDFAFIFVPENVTGTIATVVAADPDAAPAATIGYAITGGTADDAAFAISAGGLLTFVASPNFEAPADIGADNQYVIQVTATSTQGASDTQTLYIGITNVIEPGVPSDVVPSGGGGGGTPPPPNNSGNDQVNGTNSDDSIDGGTGDDTITAGIGADWVDGGDGNDIVFGGQNNDFVRGLNGNDVIYGNEGDDDVNGNLGEDQVYGDEGADSVRGGQGNDQVFGGSGNDAHVNGNIGIDLVHGDEGDDTVYGGQDNDSIYGDGGNDRLSGDLGNDIIYGGTGADRFVMLATGGVDWVADFSASEGDKVQLATGQAYSVVNVGGQAFIQLTGGGGIGLAGVSFASFDSSWVIFGA